MTATVLLLVLSAAALHATWNAIVKGAGDKLVVTVAICLAASVIAGLALPFVAQPAAASWPFIALSVVLQTTYYLLVAAAYGRANMSQAYPIMRGGAPLIVAVVSGAVFGEELPLVAWLGIGLVSGGILSLAELGRSGSRPGVGFALMNAVVIASYTLSDGLGVRASGAPAGYTLWNFLLTAPPVLACAMFMRGRGLLRDAALRWKEGILGGLGTMISYGIALWAMTQAPVAMVAALRETSILFAILISAVFLGERVTSRRIAAGALIAAGVVVLRLA